VYLGPISLVQNLVVEKNADGAAEGFSTLAAIDNETESPIDLKKVFEQVEQNATEEETRELREWIQQSTSSRTPMNSESTELVQEGLERIKTYLADHLDPTTNSLRQGKYGLEPEA
jgi:hypothetical protein